jgi:hypothetical protein
VSTIDVLGMTPPYYHDVDLPGEVARPNGGSHCPSLPKGDFRCGPDITKWLISEINKNSKSAQIMKIRENINSGNTIAAYAAWTSLVYPGHSWDHKPSLNRAKGRDCPKGDECRLSLTLCGRCVATDVASNIHYGFVGRVGGLLRSPLVIAPGLVQTTKHWPFDDSMDTNAIKVGMELADSALNGHVTRTEIVVPELVPNPGGPPSVISIVRVADIPEWNAFSLSEDSLCSGVRTANLSDPPYMMGPGRCKPCTEEISPTR